LLARVAAGSQCFETVVSERRTRKDASEAVCPHGDCERTTDAGRTGEKEVPVADAPTVEGEQVGVLGAEHDLDLILDLDGKVRRRPLPIAPRLRPVLDAKPAAEVGTRPARRWD
jgi:hypothetical protein